MLTATTLPITLRLRKGSPECIALAAAVNQGIDAHLEAVTESHFKDCGGMLQADLSAKDAEVIMRRLLETQTHAGRELAATINRRQHTETVDAFTHAYLLAALWTESDQADDSGGQPLEDNFGPEDIAREALLKVQDDCWRFQDRCRAELAELRLCGDPERALAQAGHDFWLTRNRHGSGFLDRGGSEDIQLA